MQRRSQTQSERLSLHLSLSAVVTIKQEEALGDVQLDVTLANGVRADLSRLSLDDVLAILPVLSALPCFASTRS